MVKRCNNDGYKSTLCLLYESKYNSKLKHSKTADVKQPHHRQKHTPGTTVQPIWWKSNKELIIEPLHVRDWTHSDLTLRGRLLYSHTDHTVIASVRLTEQKGETEGRLFSFFWCVCVFIRGLTKHKILMWHNTLWFYYGGVYIRCLTIYCTMMNRDTNLCRFE